MGSKKIIASLWLGEKLDQNSELCLRSWVRHAPKVALYTFEPVSNVPDGIQQLNAMNIPGVREAYYREKALENPSGFSNFFRMKLLQSENAIWLDTDVLMLGGLSKYSGAHIFGFEDKESINGAVLSLPRNSVALDDLLKELTLQSGKRILFGDLGPAMLTKVLRRKDLTDLAYGIQEFYEIKSTEIWKLYSASHFEEMASRLGGKSLCHLWNEAGKLAPVGLHSVKPQEGSFLYSQDPHFWKTRSEQPITNRQLEKWGKRMVTAQLRNRFSSLLPESVRRQILFLLGRGRAAGF